MRETAIQPEMIGEPAARSHDDLRHILVEADYLARVIILFGARPMFSTASILKWDKRMKM